MIFGTQDFSASSEDRDTFTDAVDRKPYMDTEGAVAYQESIVKRLPDPPKRKDRI